jgi:diguanylate cyclase (GGDEF)-like protein
MGLGVANDDDAVISVTDAAVLLSEIERLTAVISALESRVGELDQLAHRDALVNLPNRRSFLASLDRVIARVDRYGDPAAVVFVDVDGLKAINDTFGHKAGDAALIEIGRMLAASVRNSDCVARLGGDEFGILLEHADELTAWQTALRIVETVVDSECCVDGACLPLSVAVGVGVISQGDTPQLVIDRADKEMYRVKAA